MLSCFKKVSLPEGKLGFIFQILDILFQIYYISNDIIMSNLLQSAIEKCTLHKCQYSYVMSFKSV